MIWFPASVNDSSGVAIRHLNRFGELNVIIHKCVFRLVQQDYTFDFIIPELIRERQLSGRNKQTQANTHLLAVKPIEIDAVFELGFSCGK